METSKERQIGVRRRLAFVRHLFLSAKEQCRRPPPFSYAGLLTLHDAAESFLALSCELHEAGRKSRDFLQYFNDIQQKTGISLTQRKGMERLNDARVALKHYGTWPNPEELDQFEVITALFLQENCDPVFGCPFDSITFADFVEYPEAREQIAHAELHLSEGRYAEAMENLRVAFELAVWRCQKQSGWGYRPLGPFRGQVPSAFDGRDNPELANFVRTLEGRVTELERKLATVTIGIDPHRLKEFKDRTPHVSVAMSGAHEAVWVGGTDHLTADHVTEALSFTIDSCLALQKSMPYDSEGGAGTGHRG